jgi:hypothetical protein
MSLNQPLLMSSALVHQVLLSPTTYPYKQVTASDLGVARASSSFLPSGDGLSRNTTLPCGSPSAEHALVDGLKPHMKKRRSARPLQWFAGHSTNMELETRVATRRTWIENHLSPPSSRIALIVHAGCDLPPVERNTRGH